MWAKLDKIVSDLGAVGIPPDLARLPASIDQRWGDVLGAPRPKKHREAPAIFAVTAREVVHRKAIPRGDRSPPMRTA